MTVYRFPRPPASSNSLATLRPEINAHAIAAEFLDQWQRAHSVDGEVDYRRLSSRLKLFTGEVSLGEATAVFEELRKQRRARGWPDPHPGTVEPAIEAAIVAIWLPPSGATRTLD